ncbi:MULTISPECIES: pyrroline-5-carboxylate reductase [unclassified Adlercreutzia]|uniref:pyrroline-5-carboxylate reductase n=1 Tax=unclassified Adlercreutzia TaxID=2636013 RepID=UPI0013EDA9FB|nr:MULTISPECIES: pyrroline-5-carboxylate reductase [unclassified Adlercreutzia]
MAGACEVGRVSVIGGGKMGEAVLGGWIAAQEGPARALGAGSFGVADPGEERRAYLAERYGVACVPDARELPRADVVVLAVKPQVMMGVLETIRAHGSYVGGEGGPLFVSIAAGLTTERLEAALPEGARLVRVMPNTPLLVSAGATAVCAGARASRDDVRFVCELFSSLGLACEVPEADMDAVCALSGSGPAYVAALVEALRDAAAKHGIAPDLGEQLALQTVYGTALLMKETGISAETCRVNVCSPGGTTLAALNAMNAAGFASVFEAGVDAAVTRSKELASC